MPPRTPKKPSVRLMIAAVAMSALAVPVLVIAQNGAPQGSKTIVPEKTTTYDTTTLHMESKLGSFKLLGKGPEAPPKGTLSISFKGSLLVSGIEGKGTLTPSGAIKREYYDQKHNKQVWFGEGKIVLDGTMRNVEWFGENMQATFKGDGYFRLMGEFDAEEKTGFYWFDPNNKYPWLPSGSNVPVPEQRTTIPGTSMPPPPGPARSAGG